MERRDGSSIYADMAVLCQAITMVIPVDVIEEKYPKGLNGYRTDDGRIRYSDGILAGASFMTPSDVQKHVAGLVDLLGFKFVDEARSALEIVVIDQETGPTSS